jgi:hypothetical protein
MPFCNFLTPLVVRFSCSDTAFTSIDVLFLHRDDGGDYKFIIMQLNNQFSGWGGAKVTCHDWQHFKNRLLCGFCTTVYEIHTNVATKCLHSVFILY